MICQNRLMEASSSSFSTIYANLMDT